MDRIKKLLRVNTLALNFQSVYSILLNQYFLPIDEAVISTPFINLLYKTYPDIVTKIFRNNITVIYGYLLRLKLQCMKDCILLYPNLLVDSVRIYLERMEVNDVYKLKLGNDKLMGFINEDSIDSFLTTEVDINTLDVATPAPAIYTHINSATTRELVKFLTIRNKITYIPLDQEMTSTEILRSLLLQEITNNPFIDRLVKSIRNYLLDPSKYSLVGVYPELIQSNNSILLALQELKISRKLLHNVFLYLYKESDDLRDLYMAFMLYPYSLTFSEGNLKTTLEYVAPIEFFNNVTEAVEYYNEFLNPNIIKTYRDQNDINLHDERSIDQHIRFSLVEDIEQSTTVNTDIIKHNTAQLARQLKNLNSKQYYGKPQIDVSLLSSLLGNTYPIVPSDVLFSSLEETLDYYLPLIPETSITAILLLLLYNSTDYLIWLNIYKKHSKIMLEIISRSTLLSQLEKQNLENTII